AVTTWVQAIAWSPLPYFARIPALLLAVLPPAALGSWRAYDPERPQVYWLATAGSLAWMGAAYGFAVFGLSRARNGDQSYLAGWRTRSRIRENSADIDSRVQDQYRAARPSFSSASAAQLWFECRRSIPFLPIIFAMIVIPLLVPVCMQALCLHGSEGLMLGPLGVVQPVVLMFGVLVFTALLVSALSGANIAKPDLWSKEELTSFFAAKPVTTVEMVARKIKAAAVSAAIGWAMVVFVIATWVILDSSPLNPHKSLTGHWLHEASAKDIAGIALAI